MSLFVLFLVYWIGLTWVAYSYAGEKMPWLTVHFALPMILIWRGISWAGCLNGSIGRHWRADGSSRSSCRCS